jgi:hypothetical protein
MSEHRQRGCGWLAKTGMLLRRNPASQQQEVFSLPMWKRADERASFITFVEQGDRGSAPYISDPEGSTLRAKRPNRPLLVTRGVRFVDGCAPRFSSQVGNARRIANVSEHSQRRGKTSSKSGYLRSTKNSLLRALRKADSAQRRLSPLDREN